MVEVKVGIDAGGSLIKIAFEENGTMHYKKYMIEEMVQAMSWLKIMLPTAKIGLTGGKAHIIKQMYYPTGIMIPEFQASCKGAQVFLIKENRQIDQPYLLVNIGTGTSWHYVIGEDYQRVLGSGVGGGIFTGLGSILTKENDYNQLTYLAKTGEKGNVDLLVKDIYESDLPPIDGNLTAANFAKGIKGNHTESDRMASLTNLIVETIVLLTLQAAEIHQVKTIVYIGSTLIGNDALRDGLGLYMDRLGLTAVFLPGGEYCGALGACLTV